MEKFEIEKLKKLALETRKTCIETQYLVKSGHLGGSFSAMEIMIYLYFNKMNVSPESVEDLNRDVFIISKGHASLGYYAVMAKRGYFPEEELKTYRQINTRLQGHTHMDAAPGIECSTGSLGQGLSYGLGIALAKKQKNLGGKVYVLLGDGEMQEGQIWEALMLQSKLQLDKLVPIIDDNRLQLDDSVEKIVGRPNYEERLRAFGNNVIEVDGQEFESIDKGFNSLKQNASNIIVAHTTKGAGISFMENSVPWHSKKLSDEEYEIAMKEIKDAEVICHA
ncbi:MAG: transketolase [Tissierellales bacterium]|nr:transketolase [Tissierellales bacterium]